ANQTIQNVFTKSGGGNNTQTLALTGTGSGTITLSGNITNGSGQRMIAITKNGANSTFVLSGSGSNYGGSLSISAGTLVAASSAATGTGTMQLGGGILNLMQDTGTNFGNDTTVTANSTVISNRLTSGAGVNHTLGALSIGAFTLTDNAGNNV